MTFTTILSVLLIPGNVQAQYRHRVLLEDRFIHQPVTGQDCTVCHEPHFPEGPGETLKPVPDLCLVCHENPASGKKILHAPLEKGECLTCHYPHSAPVKSLLKTSAGRLCTGCHKEKEDGRHGKMQFDGDCLKCHEPHASDTSDLLKTSIKGQCGICHSTITGGEQIHSALEEYECGDCHNPHISPPEPPIACDECHDDQTSGDNLHGALGEGCQYCHDPHSGSYPNQLSNPVPDLCLECHDDKEGGKHGNVDVGTDCARCHVPHSSMNRGLLTAYALNAPCISCHASIAKARYRHTPVRNTECEQCHDPHSGSSLSGHPGCLDCHPGVIEGREVHYAAEDGCENCHNTHGSDLEYQLTDQIPALCLDCHPDQEGGRHGGVKLDDKCGACHDPHSSGQAGLLTVELGSGNCTSCHEEQTRGTYIHSAVTGRDCSDCHEPHADPPGKSVSCLDCHDKLLSGSTRHDAAEDDCANCHETHSGQYPALLTEGVPALCLECHDGKEGGKHGDGLFGDRCSGCHDPHSSSRSKLLKIMEEDSCGYCHSKITDGRYTHSALDQYRCGYCHNPHEDPPAMPPLACQQCHLGVGDNSTAHGRSSQESCLECHDPHVSETPYLSRADGLRPAGDCVDCHRDIGRDIEGGNFLHEPVAGGECSDCHTLHQGQPPFTRERFDTSKNVPYEPGAYDLCFQCHSEEMVEARLTESDTAFRNGKLNLHNLHVVRDGENGYSCWVCHDTHASGQPHLIINKVPLTALYDLKIDYQQTKNGGRCLTNCHTVQEYSR